VWLFVVLVLSCRVFCCSCCVLVCVTCFSSFSLFPPARVHEYEVGERGALLITDSNNLRRAREHIFTLPLRSCSRSSLHTVLSTVSLHRREFLGTHWEKGAVVYSQTVTIRRAHVHIFTPPLSSFSQAVYNTKGTHAHTQRELI